MIRRGSTPITSPGPYSRRLTFTGLTLLTAIATGSAARAGKLPPPSGCCTSATRPRRVHGRKRYLGSVGMLCVHLHLAVHLRLQRLPDAQRRAGGGAAAH